MLKSIEELLKLQNWDKKILQHSSDLEAIQPHKQYLQQKLEQTEGNFKKAQENFVSVQSQQKQLELEISSIEEKIRKYSHQQLETKKNEEYQALNKEIDHCKSKISETEDQLLEVMESLEAAKKAVDAASTEATELAENVQKEIAQADEREVWLKSTLEDCLSQREQQSGNVEDKVLRLYERLMVKKAGSVLVGIDRGMCGGCHMKLTTQSVLTAKGGSEISTCTNCGRMLYHLPGMEIPIAE